MDQSYSAKKYLQNWDVFGFEFQYQVPSGWVYREFVAVMKFVS